MSPAHAPRTGRGPAAGRRTTTTARRGGEVRA